MHGWLFSGACVWPLVATIPKGCLCHSVLCSLFTALCTLWYDSTIPEHQVYILVRPGIHKSSGKDSPSPRHADSPRRLGKYSGTVISHATQSPERSRPEHGFASSRSSSLRPLTAYLICSWENIHAGFNGTQTSLLGTRLADLSKYPAGSGSSLTR